MEQLFNKAWRQQALWLWLLLPLSWLYRLISWMNKMRYRLGLAKSYYPPVPVIVIGNITVGGSGKTPLIIVLVKFLQQRNIKVGVISRGYGGDTKQMPAMVTPLSSPEQVGDEPCLIVQSTQVPMAVCPNRGQAIELLLSQYTDIQLILADDGLQHYALDRDMNWIVVDADRGFGNRQLLPTGFLREPISRLTAEHTTVIYHKKNWQQSASLSNNKNSLSNNNLLMRLQEQAPVPLFDDQKPMDEARQLLIDDKPIIAMTGIGYPQRFFNSLSILGFNLIQKPLNDHHKFSLSDFKNLPDLPIIVTSKDAVKIKPLLNQLDETNEINNSAITKLQQHIWVLPVTAELSDEVYTTLLAQLRIFGIEC